MEDTEDKNTDEGIIDEGKEEQVDKSPLEEVKEIQKDIEEKTALLKKENERLEKNLADAQIAGKSKMPEPIKKPEPLTDEEFSREFEQGKVDIFKD